MATVIEKDTQIGKRVAKPDAPDKAVGRTRFINDLQLPRMLFGRIRRAGRAHARIVGIDTAAARALPGVHAVITAADTPQIAIGVGKDIAAQKDFYGVRTVGEILNRFAGETGGRAYFATRVGKLRRAYENVATALRHQYSLGYTSSNSKQDGSWRKIRVLVDREGYEVDARKGYYAPG